MTSLTDIALTNQALRLLGEFSVASFEEGTDLSESCNQIVPTTIRALLVKYPWRFTMRKVQLARLTEAPLTEWAYQHAMPADQIFIRAVRPGSSAAPADAWEIFENRILSNHQILYCDYQVEIDSAAWPAWFTELARCALAADLAVAVGAGNTLGDYFYRRAYGSPLENGAGGLMRQARHLDSQQQTPQALGATPLVTARWGR
jgi:hypothetical protein